MIQPTPESADTPKADMSYEGVVDTMGDDILDETEWKMVGYLMTLIIAVGRNIKLMMTINLYLMPLKKILDINYTYGSLKQPTKKIFCGG